MTTKTYDKIDVNALPDLNQGKSFSVDDLPDLKKKGGASQSNDTGVASSTGTESTSPAPSFSL